MNTAITPNAGAAHTALVKDNKATPAGHKADAAGICPGASPLTPQVKQSDRVRRSVTLKIRLTKKEYAKLLGMLPDKRQRRGISTFVRDRVLLSRRSGSISSQSLLFRNLAGIKNELHHVARLANHIPNPLTVVEVLVVLTSLDQAVDKLTCDTNRKVQS